MTPQERAVEISDKLRSEVGNGPFDQRDVAKVLLAAADLIEVGWCRNHFAMSDCGGVVAPTDKEASRWCALGAIFRVAQHSEVLIGEVTEKLYNKCGWISLWNDRKSQTAADIARGMREAAK